MDSERKIRAYKTYFKDFIESLRPEEAKKVFYVLDMLKSSNLMDIDAMMDAQFGAVGSEQRTEFRKEAYDYCVGQILGYKKR